MKKMTVFLQILGALFVCLVLIGVIGVVLLKWHMGRSREHADSLKSEFAVGQPIQGIVKRADQLGFVNFQVQDENHKVLAHHDPVMKELMELDAIQGKIDQTPKGNFEAVMIPFPPFLRWFVLFQFENGRVTSVEETQLD